MENYATPFTLAAIIFGVIMLAAVPPLGIVILIVAAASSRRQKVRTDEVYYARLERARMKRRRDYLIAGKALGSTRYP